MIELAGPIHITAQHCPNGLTIEKGVVITTNGYPLTIQVPALHLSDDSDIPTIIRTFDPAKPPVSVGATGEAGTAGTSPWPHPSAAYGAVPNPNVRGYARNGEDAGSHPSSVAPTPGGQGGTGPSPRTPAPIVINLRTDSQAACGPMTGNVLFVADGLPGGKGGTGGQGGEGSWGQTGTPGDSSNVDCRQGAGRGGRGGNGAMGGVGGAGGTGTDGGSVEVCANSADAGVYFRSEPGLPGPVGDGGPGGVRGQAGNGGNQNNRCNDETVSRRGQAGDVGPVGPAGTQGQAGKAPGQFVAINQDGTRAAVTDPNIRPSEEVIAEIFSRLPGVTRPQTNTQQGGVKVTPR